MREPKEVPATVTPEAPAFVAWTPAGMRHSANGTAAVAGPARPARGRFAGICDGSPTQVVAAVRRGLPVAVFEELRSALEVPARALADTTSIAPRTLARRKGEGRLHKDESERVLRICALFELATEVLEDRDAARRWLTSPKRALGGHTPLEYADTEPGAREVEALLMRLEYGVFS